MGLRETPSGLAVIRQEPMTVVRDRPIEDMTLMCRLCFTRFAKDEHTAFENHVVSCGEEHQDVIAEMSPRRRLPLLSSEGGPDPEREEWVKKHAADILHGRKNIAQGGV